MRIGTEACLASRAAAYRVAKPFPHCVVDGLFPDATLDRVLEATELIPHHEWRRFDNDRECKWGLVYRGFRDTPLFRFMAYLNSPDFLERLEGLTGIAGLIPDPYFGGGGVHHVPRGGFLGIHADFNWHPKLKLDRRVNVLIYLNRGWTEEYGGHLELWNGAERRCCKRILPVFNRTVVFNTTDDSFHGHPVPVACPAHMGRKSISVYYYTNGRPGREKKEPHDTIFLDKEGPAFHEY